MKVRVSVTGSMRTVTFAVWSPMTRHAGGSAKATSVVTLRVAPETDRRRVRRHQRLELVQVALDGHHERLDVDRRDPEAGAGGPGHDRVDGTVRFVEVLVDGDLTWTTPGRGPRR